MDIELRKKILEAFREIRQSAKHKECVLCGNSLPICNSHLIPQFILKNIAANGELINFERFAHGEQKVIDTRVGVNRSGTFHCICQKCDGVLFSDYENENNIRSKKFNNHFLSQVIIKNCLSRFYKKSLELYLPSVLAKYGIYMQNEYNYLDSLSKDIEYCKETIAAESHVIKQNRIHQHCIIYQKTLPYTVPFATQAYILVHRDLSGNIVNDIDHFEKIMHPLHICVFPLKKETMILLFISKRSHKCYQSFCKSFNQMADTNKLHYLFYLVLKHTEDVFFSPLVDDSVLCNLNLQSLAKEVYDKTELGIWESNEANPNYKLVNYPNIPNLFLEKYCIC